MEYVTPKDKAVEWGISQRRVEILCESGRILGASRLGRVWAIPKQAVKPLDEKLRKANKENWNVLSNDYQRAGSLVCVF